MPKRDREQSDTDDYGEADVSDNLGRGDDGFKIAVNQIIGIILSKDMKNQYFRRDHLTSDIKVRKFGFAKLIEKVDQELQHIYGLKLVEVESKNKKKLQYGLVSNLDDNSKSILSKLWQKTVDESFDNRSVESRQYFLPQNKSIQLPSSNSELVKLGILFLILSIIIIAENYITEVELFEILQSFGISKNQNVRNSNFGLNLSELINEYIKREYLQSSIVRGTIESENVTSYSLGLRAMIELQPQDVYNCMKQVWGKKFNENEATKVIETIKRVFNVELTNEFEHNNED